MHKVPKVSLLRSRGQQKLPCLEETTTTLPNTSEGSLCCLLPRHWELLL